MSTSEQQMSGRGNVIGHCARTLWMLLGAMLAVVVGFATVNMVLADSGFAVLNEHSPMLTAFLTRMTRQG
ncbi:MAG: hypothetical protein ACXVZX_04055 [Terriglobales bacterium]